MVTTSPVLGGGPCPVCQELGGFHDRKAHAAREVPGDHAYVRVGKWWILRSTAETFEGVPNWHHGLSDEDEVAS